MFQISKKNFSIALAMTGNFKVFCKSPICKIGAIRHSLHCCCASSSTPALPSLSMAKSVHQKHKAHTPVNHFCSRLHSPWIPNKVFYDASARSILCRMFYYLLHTKSMQLLVMAGTCRQLLPLRHCKRPLILLDINEQRQQKTRQRETCFLSFPLVMA